jgi:hypothetical protein
MEHLQYYFYVILDYNIQTEIVHRALRWKKITAKTIKLYTGEIREI